MTIIEKKVEKKNFSNKVLEFLEDDILINAMGIYFVANRTLRKKIN